MSCRIKVINTQLCGHANQKSHEYNIDGTLILHVHHSLNQVYQPVYLYIYALLTVTTFHLASNRHSFMIPHGDRVLTKILINHWSLPGPIICGNK